MRHRNTSTLTAVGAGSPMLFPKCGSAGESGGKSEPIPPNRWQQWMETQALFPVLLRPQAQVSTPGKGEGLRQLQGAEQDPGTLGSSLRTTLPSLFCCCCFIICALECKRLPPPPTFPSLSPIRSSATFVRWWRLLNAERGRGP